MTTYDAIAILVAAVTIIINLIGGARKSSDSDMLIKQLQADLKECKDELAAKGG